MKPYTPVAPHVRERLEIAILTGELLDLHWVEEDSDHAWMARLRPTGIDEKDGAQYLEALNDQGETQRIRLDLIRNLPTPVK
ncbi:MAG: hypothetical protein P8Y64_02910 [Gammaproteobacteria bacterium]|jgi:Rho-binding antiterminator